MNPSLPVAQKAQAMAHPTWVEKQTERRFIDRLLSWYTGIPTVSTCVPSANSRMYLRVPSEETCLSTTLAPVKGHSSCSRSLRDLGRFVMSSYEATR